MSTRSFVDSNVLVYTDDADSLEKHRRAIEVVAALRRSGDGVVSTQVLQEYFVSVTRKLRVEATVARRKVELFAHLHLVQIGLTTILGAIDIQRLNNFSFWDSLIIRCAIDSGCRRLLTEDLQHGQRISGLEVVDPFQDL